MTKTQSAILLLTAVLALSSCGKPQAVSDLKSAIARLKLAGEQGLACRIFCTSVSETTA